MRATPWPSSWSRQAAWPPPASRPSWTSSPRASTSGLPWRWAPPKTCWSTSPSVRNTPKSEAAANVAPRRRSLASPFLRGGNDCGGIRTHSKKQPKTKAVPKKSTFTAHITSTSALKGMSAKGPNTCFYATKQHVYCWMMMMMMMVLIKSAGFKNTFQSFSYSRYKDKIVQLIFSWAGWGDSEHDSVPSGADL